MMRDLKDLSRKWDSKTGTKKGFYIDAKKQHSGRRQPPTGFFTEWFDSITLKIFESTQRWSQLLKKDLNWGLIKKSSFRFSLNFSLEFYFRKHSKVETRLSNSGAMRVLNSAEGFQDCAQLTTLTYNNDLL